MHNDADLHEHRPVQDHGCIQGQAKVAVLVLQLSSLCLGGVPDVEAEDLIEQGEPCVDDGDEGPWVGLVQAQPQKGEQGKDIVGQ